MEFDLYTILKDFGLPTTIILIYIIYMLPQQKKIEEKRLREQSEREEKREEKYINQTKELTEQFISSIREDNKESFKSINDNLINLYSLANERKQLDSKQIQGLLRIVISNTIVKISQRILLIIDANNLVENEDEILQDIKNMVNQQIYSSKSFLEDMEVPEKDIELFLMKVDKIKKESYLKLVEYFTVATFEIRNISEGIERVFENIEKVKTKEDAVKFFREHIKKDSIKKDDYCKLKRRIIALVDSLESELYKEV